MRCVLGSKGKIYLCEVQKCAAMSTFHLPLALYHPASILYLKDTRVHGQQLTLLAAASFAPKHAWPKTKDPQQQSEETAVEAGEGEGDEEGVAAGDSPQYGAVELRWHSTSAGLFLFLCFFSTL